MNVVLIIFAISLSAVVAGMAFLLLGALRQIGIINERLAIVARPYVSNRGLDVGAPAPSFTARDVVSARTLDFEPVRHGPALLLFVLPTCKTCRQLLAGMPDRVPGYRLLIVTAASPTAAAEWARAEAIHELFVDEGDAISTAYGVVGITPFTVAVADGTVKAKGVVNHWDEVAAMMRHALGEHDHAEVARVSLPIQPEAIK